jgi:hypothetical protein
MLHNDSGADSILGDLDEFISSIDRALDGTDSRRSRHRAEVNLLRHVERNVAKGRGHVRARLWMTVTHRLGSLASTAGEPLQTLIKGHRRPRAALPIDVDTTCTECGSIMVRNGSCYECIDCGSTSGCS